LTDPREAAPSNTASRQKHQVLRKDLLYIDLVALRDSLS